MSIDAENTSPNNTENSVAVQESHHSEHHHHHHHHSDDGEHHHHHHHSGDGEHHHHHHHSGDSEHHHHHHHHHPKNATSKQRKKRRKFRGIKSTFKSFFLKHSPKNEKNETEKQKLIKRALFLLLIICIFFTSFYFLLINNIEGSGISSARKTSSEADLLRRQLVQSQNEVKALKDELAAYKAAFGELDTNE